MASFTVGITVDAGRALTSAAVITTSEFNPLPLIVLVCGTKVASDEKPVEKQPEPQAEFNVFDIMENAAPTQAPQQAPAAPQQDGTQVIRLNNQNQNIPAFLRKLHGDN